MKIWKGVGKALFWLLILALLATPLALISLPPSWLNMRRSFPR